MWGHYFTAGGLAQLAELSNLRRLCVQGCNWGVGAWKLASLTRLSLLSHLDVSHAARRLSNFDGFALASFPLQNLQVCFARLASLLPAGTFWLAGISATCRYV
jgi:hypothetical protein